jgi:hypothetical protein
MNLIEEEEDDNYNYEKSEELISEYENQKKNKKKENKNILEKLPKIINIFLKIILTIILLIHFSITIYGIISNIFKFSAIGLLIIRPISLISFCIFHSILNFGLFNSFIFIFISCLGNILLEIM